MSYTCSVIKGGTVTTPQGFYAGAVEAGIKYKKRLDLGVLYSEKPCIAAGVFTDVAIKAAPVLVSKRNLMNHTAQAVIVNSGCANAYTGDKGIADAIAGAEATAEKLKIAPSDVIVASTGVTGVMMPMDKWIAGIEALTYLRNGGSKLARAMMTTDTVPKEIAVEVKINGTKFTIGGVAKGSGMIHPNMGTMLSFITTDAAIDALLLQSLLKNVADETFNMVTVDGDTSPSDSLVALANGMSGVMIDPENNGEAFYNGLYQVCLHLAKSIARDGEGATKLIEVVVNEAASISDARSAARTIAGSPLVKTAIHGNDPNWGRIIAALARSGAKIDMEKIELSINSISMMKAGKPEKFDAKQASKALHKDTALIKLKLGMGSASATAWGCDLTKEYVTINSDYTT